MIDEIQPSSASAPRPFSRRFRLLFSLYVDSAAFFMPVGTNSFVAQQRVSSRSSVTAVRMAEATPELEQEVCIEYIF